MPIWYFSSYFPIIQDVILINLGRHSSQAPHSYSGVRRLVHAWAVVLTPPPQEWCGSTIQHFCDTPKPARDLCHLNWGLGLQLQFLSLCVYQYLSTAGFLGPLQLLADRFRVIGDCLSHCHNVPVAQRPLHTSPNPRNPLLILSPPFMAWTRGWTLRGSLYNHGFKNSFSSCCREELFKQSFHSTEPGKSGGGGPLHI